MGITTMLGLSVLGLVQEGVRRPKVIRGSECHQLPWLSTPKYPCDQFKERNDDGYCPPIKKNHTVRNYQMAIRSKRK
jgi:hypothetical protein